MKINQFIVKPYSIPFTNPLRTSGHTYTHRDGIWLCIKWEDYSGWGEAAPLVGFSKELLQEVHYTLEGFHQAIDGEIIDTEEMLFLIEAHTEGNPSARFALETAFYDLLAKHSDQSISTYLNPNAFTEISVNGIASMHTPEDGFHVLKVKVGFRNLFDEMEHLDLLRSSYGENILFRLDVNGAFDLPKAIRFCKEMEVFNIDYIEQPTLKLDDLYELRMISDIAIAVDESLTNYESLDNILQAGAADVLIIKPTLTGGVEDIKNIIETANKENLRVILTSSFETNIAQTFILHLIASLRIVEHCGIFNVNLYDEATPEVKKDYCKVPQNNGLGLFNE